MEKIKISKAAYITLIIFFINITIFLTIEIFEIVYTFSSLAKIMYIYICFPLNILGLILFFYTVYKFFFEKINILNVIFCLPLVSFIFYFYFVPLLRDN